MVVEQDVSVRLQLASMLSLGAGSRQSGPCGLLCLVSQVPGASVPSGHFQYFSSPKDKGS